jgi:chromosome segregation ATPase
VDVDRKAQEEIQAIERERRAKGAEMAQAERERWEGEVAAARKKAEAARARAAYLEADGSKLKDQIKFLLRRAQTDHELIQELRRELGTANRDRAGGQGPPQPRCLKLHPGMHKSEERKALERELGIDDSDLTLMCAAGSSGPQRPEDVIRRMRARMKASSSSAEAQQMG